CAIATRAPPRAGSRCPLSFFAIEFAPADRFGQQSSRRLGLVLSALSAPPEPFAVILGGVGYGVDCFGARLFPRQRQCRSHSCDGRLLCVPVAGTFAALGAISQTCQTPSRLTLLGQYWWAFDGHGAQ